MTLPLLTECPGCAGCSIRRQLNERDTFTRGEVAHLLALAFRSGGSLAYEMAGDIARWAADPLVRRTAEQQYRRRRGAMDAAAERHRLAEDARIAVREPLPPLFDVDEETGAEIETSWPAVAVPGAAEEPW
jgi:hypothetical protein